MSATAIAKALLMAGATAEQIVAAIEAYEVPFIEKQAQHREMARQRQIRLREKKYVNKSIFTSREQCVTVRDTSPPLVPPLEGFPTPLPKSPPLIPPTPQPSSRVEVASANYTTSPPVDSAVEYIQAFDQTGRDVFGADVWNGYRPFPSAKDLLVARQIGGIAKASPKDFSEFLRYRLDAMRLQGKPPVTTLSYFVKAYGEHCAGMTPLPMARVVESDEERKQREEMMARMDEIRNRSKRKGAAPCVMQ